MSPCNSCWCVSPEVSFRCTGCPHHAVWGLPLSSLPTQLVSYCKDSLDSADLPLWLVQMLAVWLDQDPGRRRDATEQLASCVLWSHARTGGHRGRPTFKQRQQGCKGGPA